jgi:hypothetical protein
MATEDQLAKILEKLTVIGDQVGKINLRLTRLEASAENMNNHIGFVNGVYELVKSPFHRLMCFLENGTSEKITLIEANSEK